MAKPFDENHPEFRMLVELFNRHPGESVRGKVLIGVGVIDEYLRRMIEAHLMEESETNDLLEPEGPLGPFMPRAKLCRALGFLNDDEFKQCKYFAGVRNRFAHVLACDFGDPKIVKFCKSLKIIYDNETPNVETLQQRFDNQLHISAHNFAGRADIIAKGRMQLREWPDLQQRLSGVY